MNDGWRKDRGVYKKRITLIIEVDRFLSIYAGGGDERQDGYIDCLLRSIHMIHRLFIIHVQVIGFPLHGNRPRG